MMKTKNIHRFPLKGKIDFRKGILCILLLPLILACEKVIDPTTGIKSIDGIDKLASTGGASTIGIMGETEFAVTVCNTATDRIEVYNPNDPNWNTNLKWSWKPTTALGYDTSQVSAWGNPIDVKQRRIIHPNFKPHITYMAITGGRLVTVIERSTKTKKWVRSLNSNNKPTAIELLPNGNTVVASVDGGWIRVYASSVDTPNKNNSTHAQINAANVKGLIYDHLNDILWAVSGKKLRAYKIAGQNNNPTIEELSGKTEDLPENGNGLDISPYYGNLNWLLVSTSKGAYFFRKNNRTFHKVSDSEGLASLSNQPNGCRIEMKKTEGSGNDIVSFYNPDGTQFTRTVTGGKFSKAKTAPEYYQTRKEIAVATYNVRVKTAGDDAKGNGWDRRRRPITRDVIRKYNFDIFGVQEPFSTQLDDMYADLSGTYDYFGWSDNDKNNLNGNISNKDHHFEAVFYKKNRFQLLDKGRFWLAPGYTMPNNINEGSWGGGKAKVCVWGKFIDKTNGEMFFLFNTHFFGANSITKEQSAIHVLPKMRSIAGNDKIIFMGDLNSPQRKSKSAAFRKLNESEIDNNPFIRESYAWAPAAARYPKKYPMHRKTGNGFNPDDPEENPDNPRPVPEGKQIDHIFLTTHWHNKVKSHRVIWETYIAPDGSKRRPSDHNPVMIELDGI